MKLNYQNIYGYLFFRLLLIQSPHKHTKYVITVENKRKDYYLLMIQSEIWKINNWLKHINE